jgi:lysophospholipase L1-like esterase
VRTLFLAVLAGITLYSPGSAASQAEAASRPALHVLVIGDSIPYGAQDCGYCLPFINLFGTALGRATHRPVIVTNLSDHTGIYSRDLLEHLRSSSSMRRAVRVADAIVVTIGHNDPPWNRDDDSCDGKQGYPNVSWSRYGPACVRAIAHVYRTNLDGILRQVRALRAGKPTLLRVTTDYNDIIGDPTVPPIAARVSKPFYDTDTPITCTLARKYGGKCIDTYHAFNGPNGTRPATKLLGPDHTHPNAQGHKLIARLLIRAGFSPLLR